MKLYCRDGIVIASHDISQDVPAEAYGEGIEILLAPAGYSLDLCGPVPDGAVPVPVKLYKADIWRRATDQEAEAIDAALSAQTVRLRNMFRDAVYLSSDDELFPLLRTAFESEFGPARAAELLAGSLASLAAAVQNEA